MLAMTWLTLVQNLIFARLVEHMEFMEHSESIVKPDSTGALMYYINI